MQEIGSIVVKHIISEPGDMTRYDYIIAKNGTTYIISGYESTFSFPKRLTKWEASQVKNIYDAINFINDNEKCKDVNSYTLLEVCNTINFLES